VPITDDEDVGEIIMVVMIVVIIMPLMLLRIMLLRMEVTLLI
jgi:hypothetical protein